MPEHVMEQAAQALGTDRLVVTAHHVWSQATPEASIDPTPPEITITAALEDRSTDDRPWRHRSRLFLEAQSQRLRAVTSSDIAVAEQMERELAIREAIDV